MKFANILSLTVLVATLAACGTTPPSSYYMLSAATVGDNSNSGPSIALGPVTVPDYLARREMVYNRTDNALELKQYSRWAESLESGVLRVTATNLAILLDTQKVQAWPWPRDNVPDYAVKISITELNTERSQATLMAAWTIDQPKAKADTVTVQRISTLQEQLQGNDAAAVAEAYSKLLERLAGEIAKTIKDSQVSASAG